MSKNISFQDLLEQKKWDDYKEFVSEAPGYYASQLKTDIDKEKKIRRALREEILEKKYVLRNYSNGLQEAEELLFSGRVVGIDGTIARHNMLSGMRCQIGIVAVNYFNEKIRHSYFISEAHLANEIDDVIKVLKSREYKNRPVSNLVIRALMLYREREVALRPEYADAFKMIHGPLLPFELMTGLGRLRALYSTLEILRKVISDPNIFSVISTSLQNDYVTLGTALQPGEYMVDEKYSFGQRWSKGRNDSRR